MAVNVKFATGVQILALLAVDPDTPKSSTFLAEKLGTNPVVVRRVLASLQRAGLIESQKGPSGGSRLLRRSQAVTLSDVYKAVAVGSLFHTPKVRVAGPIRVNAAIEKVFADTMRAVHAQFAKTSLADVVRQSQRKK